MAHGAAGALQPRTLTLPVSSIRLLTLDGGSPLPSMRVLPLADKCRRGRAAAAGVLRLADCGEWRCWAGQGRLHRRAAHWMHFYDMLVVLMVSGGAHVKYGTREHVADSVA